MKKIVVLLGMLLAPGSPPPCRPKGRLVNLTITPWRSPGHRSIAPSSFTDRDQCSRQLGFVLHGLWPQYQRGYPSSCTRERLDPAMEQQFAGLYPSRFSIAMSGRSTVLAPA